MKLRGYYAILDSPADGGEPLPHHPSFFTPVERARALLAAGPCMLQVRSKHSPAAALAALLRKLLPLTRAAGIPLCVNDRLDVALAVGADAVHLGQDDVLLADARRVAQGRLLIGISTHDVQQARIATDGGADYIGLGPIFATVTKRNPDPIVGTATLREIAKELGHRIPIVAIGGIDLPRISEVAAAGAAAAALISAIAKAPDPVAAGQAVNDAFAVGRS